MSKTSKTVIKISSYENHDMHFIFVNKECVFQGNSHDFTPYTHGSVIGGYETSGLWDRGIKSLANTLKSLMEKEGKTVEIKEENLTDRQYMKMGYLPE